MLHAMVFGRATPLCIYSPPNSHYMKIQELLLKEEIDEKIGEIKINGYIGQEYIGGDIIITNLKKNRGKPINLNSLGKVISMMIKGQFKNVL